MEEDQFSVTSASEALHSIPPQSMTDNFTSWVAQTSSETTPGSDALKLVYYGDVWTSDVIQRVATLTLLMIATLSGNLIIIVVLTCSKYRKVNSRVNIFIVNLALGDLTVCCVTMTTEVCCTL